MSEDYNDYDEPVPPYEFTCPVCHTQIHVRQCIVDTGQTHVTCPSCGELVELI